MATTTRSTTPFRPDRVTVDKYLQMTKAGILTRSFHKKTGYWPKGTRT
jgi:hypothetical protein